MQSTEEWRAVAGYEGTYEVSDQGSLRSLDRSVVYPNGMVKPIAGRTMHPSVNKYGYLHVSLFKNGIGKTVTMHKLVALTFLEKIHDDATEVCHGDGNRQHNRASNLRWDTRSANARDALVHGTHPKARKTECPSGHPYSGDNLIVTKSGGRQCKTCKRDWMRDNYRKAI
ncbi:hypothetical protein E3T46_07765 [Cryobacterium sp. Hh11]|uniref:NUMOD4 domain-containing protein n=1 Tax=Cryobacterium sp. Hh11 TaxID=2555868 RepID=UPI00106BEBB6|nr:NUMOD4 domain-containing protein [Cryobacterium sp. Hh11]TFD51976.1 hypothetical protein E3T46_07765 [Cryobacterium sp. Hh11]